MTYTFHDHLNGDITAVVHDNGRITLEYERVEADEAIIPFFTLDLKMEHVAAWIALLLEEECERRCMLSAYDKRQLQMMLDRTRSDPKLVYCVHSDTAVVIVRDGRVLKSGFRPSLTVNGLLNSIGEQRGAESSLPVPIAFAQFARNLI